MYAPAGGGEHQISRAPFIDFAVDRTTSTPSEIIVDGGGGMTMRSVDYAWRTNRNSRREIRRRAIGSSTRGIIEHIHPPGDVASAATRGGSSSTTCTFIFSSRAALL